MKNLGLADKLKEANGDLTGNSTCSNESSCLHFSLYLQTFKSVSFLTRERNDLGEGLCHSYKCLFETV